VRVSQRATAAALVAVAAIAMFDSRASALFDTTGRSPGGIGPGFYPFWAAAVMAVGGLILVLRPSRADASTGTVFESREAVGSLVKLVGPMLLATAAMVWLGFYLVTCLYMGFFARYIGRYRWLWVALIAVVVPMVIYLAFELGFRVRLPKSMLYDLGFPI
jgi:putative tricarboxylic transport membrane protein